MKHLLVPVDASALSSANVLAAVRLAVQLGARITFFHATRDMVATSDGVLLEVIAPTLFEEHAVGATHAVLEKARASALAASVPCNCVSKVSDHPAQAIVEMALQEQCDLIVMASRGERGIAGWLHSSQTEKVLKTSPIAVMVTRVASTLPWTQCERALSVIVDEHRSIASVVHGMQRLVERMPVCPGDGDLRSLRAMVRYMEEFPTRLHHPKEELLIHRTLRQRDVACEALLAQLEAQHQEEYRRVHALMESVDSCMAGEQASKAQVVACVQALAQGIWEHMGLEESQVFPLARRCLTDSDWEAIFNAFSANYDAKLSGLDGSDFDRYFTRIANLMSK